MNIATEKLTEALEKLTDAATLLENIQSSGIAATYLIDEAQGDVTAAGELADMAAQRLAALLFD